MDAGTTYAYRNRKRPLNGRPCNPKVKRRLFPADVPCPNRRAAEMDRLLLKRQRRRRVIGRASFLIEAAADELCLLVEMGSYSRRELDPFYESTAIFLSAMQACEAAVAPVKVRPDVYDDPTSSDDDDDHSTSYSSPPSFVASEGTGAAFVPVTRGDETIRSKRQAKANGRYSGPEWRK